MISTGRDFGPYGKGVVAESVCAAQSGTARARREDRRDCHREMISVLRYWICLTQVTAFDSAVTFFGFWSGYRRKINLF